MELGIFYHYERRVIVTILLLLVAILVLSQLTLPIELFIFFILSLILFIFIINRNMFLFPNIKLTNKGYYITTFFNRKSIIYDLSEFDRVAKETILVAFTRYETKVYIYFTDGNKYPINLNYNSLVNRFEPLNLDTEITKINKIISLIAKDSNDTDE